MQIIAYIPNEVCSLIWHLLVTPLHRKILMPHKIYIHETRVKTVMGKNNNCFVFFIRTLYFLCSCPQLQFSL